MQPFLPQSVSIAAALLSALGFISRAAQPGETLHGQVTVGAARFTVIAPECIRLEYNEKGNFVDEPSYFALNRSRRDESARIKLERGELDIDTGAMALHFKQDGKSFSADNLQVAIRQGGAVYDWVPGKLNHGNLGGATVTLDMWEGARRLPDGILSQDGWCLLDDSRTALLTSDWVAPRPKDAGIDWYFFGYGHDYKRGLKALTAIGGEVPLPRRSLLGVWYSRFWAYTEDDFRQLVREFAEHDYPLDVIVMDMDWHITTAANVPLGSSNLVWTGYTWNRQLLPDAEELLKWFHQQGLAVTLNDHPAGGVYPHEACYADFMKAVGRDASARKTVPFNAGDRRYMEAFYSTTHVPLEKEGVDFWWLDWQQAPFVPNFTSLLNLAWLNQYYFEQSARDGRRGVSFSRWAGWGDHRHPIHFSGDAATSFDMLAFEVPFTTTSGNSGCFFWSHDIGGHNKGRNEESYARWCQFGAFSAAMRPHSNRDRTMDRRPWTYSERAERSMRTSFRLRSRFFPTVYSAVRQSCAESIPLLRPMYLEYPDLPDAYRQPQQYLFGDNILVAPVVEPGAGPNQLARQAVWFPPGSAWFNFFTGERYAGGAEALVAAEIDEFPLYLRGGTPVAMRPFVQRPGTAPLTELIVRCYPGPDGQTSSSALYEDDGETVAFRSGAFAQTRMSYTRKENEVTVRVEPTDGDYNGQVKERAITVELPATEPATEVAIDGQPAKGAFTAAESMNIVRIPPRSIRLGCTVTVSAPNESSELFRMRAFAKRMGLAELPLGATVKDLLARALSSGTTRAANPAQLVALAGAAGVGLFEKNENATGYPVTKTPRAYVPADSGIQIEPIFDGTNSTAPPFKVYIDGVGYLLNPPRLNLTPTLTGFSQTAESSR